MILFAHIAVAASVSAAGRFSPAEAFFFGLISHHILDLIPHVDAGHFWPKSQRESGFMPKTAKAFISADILFSLGFLVWAGFALKISWPLLFWAAAGAALPDMITTGFPLFFPGMRRWRLVRTYEKLHYTFLTRLGFAENLIVGITTTLVVIGFSFWWLLK